MKRFGALLLGIVMTISIVMPAFAVEEDMILQDEVIVEEGDFEVEEIIVEDASGEEVDEETKAAIIEEFLSEEIVEENTLPSAEEETVVELPSVEGVINDAQTIEYNVGAKDESSTKKNAKKVNIKKLTKANFNQAGDQDYYKFETTVEAKYTFEVKTSLDFAHVQIIEDSDRGIISDESLKAGTNKVTLSLSGDHVYWLCFYDDYETGAYSFKASKVQDLKLRPSIKKIKAGKNGTIDIKIDNWKKVDRVYCYVSLYKNMKNAKSYFADKKNISKYKGSLTLPGIKKGKTNYVTIMGYTTVVYKGDRYNLYTKFSNIKSVKTKK